MKCDKQNMVDAFYYLTLSYLYNIVLSVNNVLQVKLKLKVKEKYQKMIKKVLCLK